MDSMDRECAASPLAPSQSSSDTDSESLDTAEYSSQGREERKRKKIRREQQVMWTKTMLLEMESAEW